MAKANARQLKLGAPAPGAVLEVRVEKACRERRPAGAHPSTVHLIRTVLGWGGNGRPTAPNASTIYFCIARASASAQQQTGRMDHKRCINNGISLIVRLARRHEQGGTGSEPGFGQGLDTAASVVGFAFLMEKGDGKETNRDG